MIYVGSHGTSIDTDSETSGGLGVRFFNGKSSSSLSSLMRTISLIFEILLENAPEAVRFKLGNPVLDSLPSLNGMISEIQFSVKWRIFTIYKIHYIIFTVIIKEK